ncbi:nucleotidyltransferase domain-containing protein [Rubrobacter marinus]|uniref:Nucleotidyltransferase domain-containing protein n=1 Tax=Rubrobacter marinus TaxID=2653852 RepID=A0A6G8PUB2_9ACTN|nr:nucleotidyltransferase domain-containing protein [Rubrobacter marinus]QIN77943.1 nucleotidyltransferase domain-containing protein [Rubrobacter marinus]
MNGGKLSAEELSELLNKLGRGLKDLYGERYRGLVLYGSYARGEADEGSDVDVLLLLDGEVDTVRELVRAEEVKWPLSLEAGYTVSLLPVSLTYYRNSGEPFVRNVRREGVAVA